MAEGLADTGALLALLDLDDSWHSHCVQAFRSLPLPLVTSQAVVTELHHLVGDSPRQVEAAFGLLLSGAFALAPISHEELPALARLMARYAARPMDFADATLVHLAERERLTTVFTVAVDDFETYRIGKRRRFRVVPGRH